MSTVDIVHWNPRRGILPGPLGRSLTFIGRRPNNFGDLIGPYLVARIVDIVGAADAPPRPARLLSVGSILQYARDGDTVWGSGVNGKVPVGLHSFAGLDVRAVRGPLTAEFLRSKGIPVPDVFGDPALLLPAVHPRLSAWAAQKRYDITVVPNMRDAARYVGDSRTILPTARFERVLERIARSRMVVGSSLHALIVAESLGIPARAVVSGAEHPWKYEDYYLGTGRSGFTPGATADEAARMGGEEPLAWDPLPLATAFPWDLWGRDVNVDAWFSVTDDRS